MPTVYVLSRNMKNIRIFIWKCSFFLVVKFSVYLNRHVFVMKPHFYIVKLGFTGVYIIFLISAQNTDWGYSLEPPQRGGSNEYPQSMFWGEIWKISEFLIWKFSFFVVNFSVFLNRSIFVMFSFLQENTLNGHLFLMCYNV